MAMNKKTLPHQNRSKSQPPTIGPVAMPIPVVAPHSPMARARSRRSVNTFTSNERVDGNMRAAPIPMTARAAMSSPVVPDAAPARLPTAKTVRPMSSVPLRPKRSLRLPAARTKAAKTRLYASTTHWSCVDVAPTSRTRVGNATFTIVTSTLTTKAARQRAMRTSVRLFMLSFIKLSGCLSQALMT